jgi:hypothetical protein
MRMDAEIAMQEHAENGVRAQVPACPTQRRIPVGVLCIDLCARIEQQLNRFFIAEGPSAVQRGSRRTYERRA